MGKYSLKSDFNKFFVNINEYTDLLLKIYEAREVVIPQEKKK